MNPAFIRHAVQRAKQLMLPAFRNKRMGSNWQNPRSHCVRTTICGNGRTCCAEWQNNWKCVRRRRSEPWLCETFESPEGTKYKTTDCATYVREVLGYAFRQVGNPVAATAQARHGGYGLIKYLVNSLGWDAVYWNPDVLRPADGNPIHPFSYIIAVKGELKTGKAHYQYSRKNIYVPLYNKRGDFIDIKDMVVQYKPNSTGKTFRTAFTVWNNISVPPPSRVKLKVFKKVKFGVVCANAGLHNALIIEGKVYEAHWKAGPTDRNDPLYGTVDFEDWKNGSDPWSSGVLATPAGGWADAQAAP